MENVVNFSILIKLNINSVVEEACTVIFLAFFSFVHVKNKPWSTEHKLSEINELFENFEIQLFEKFEVNYLETLFWIYSPL